MKLYRERDYGKSGIYMILNLINDKVYVGKASNIYDRITGHISMLNSKSLDENRHLINAWWKYGRENFAYYVLEYLPLDEKLIAERELHWQLELKCTDRKHGYNLRLDSSTKMICSDETREKLRYAQSIRHEKFPHLRKQVGDKSSKFWKENPDIKDQMRKKVSDASRAYNIAKLDRELNILEIFNGRPEIIEKYPDYYVQAILGVCNGGKNSYKGFIWRYIDRITGEILHKRVGKCSKLAVLMLSKETNEILMEFESNQTAADYLGWKGGGDIGKQCKNKTFFKTKDYYFRYKDETQLENGGN